MPDPNLPVPRIELWKHPDEPDKSWFVELVADPTLSVGSARCGPQPDMSAESCVATWVAATGWQSYTSLTESRRSLAPRK